MSTPLFERALQQALDTALPGQRVCEETGELFDITAEDIERCKQFKTLLPTTSFHARIRLWSRACEECQLPVQVRSAPGSAGRILCTECFEQMRLAT